MATLNSKEREDILFKYLVELCLKGKYDRRLEEVFDKNKLENEVKRLMDTLWKNRQNDNVSASEIFNSAYYANILDERQKIVDEVGEKRIAVKKAQINIKKSRKGIKQEIFDNANIELRDAQKKLKEFDFNYNNTNYQSMISQDIISKIEVERSWINSVATICTYFNATDFAIIMQEQLERMFFRKRKIINNKDKFSEKLYGKARQFFREIDKSVQKWSDDHETEGSLFGEKDIKKMERQQFLIEHIQQFMRSYVDKKKLGTNEEELHITIRQMEIAVNLLIKKFS